MRIAKIALLALFVASTLIVSTGTSSAAVPCTPIGVFQDDNPNGSSPDVDFDYYGSWTHSTTSAGAVYGTESYSIVTGNPIFDPRVSFTLNCVREFEIYYAKANSRIIIDVLVNGQKIQTIDQYSPGVQWAQKTVVKNLPPGVVNVTVRSSGKSSSDTPLKYIGFDGIKATKSW